MNLSYFDTLIDQRLLSVSTIFLARVISHNGTSFCTVQPLSFIKAVGGSPKKQAVLPNVPISQAVLRTLYENETLQGKVAIVAACERDISQTRKNTFALPSIRHHSKSDSVVIGYL